MRQIMRLFSEDTEVELIQDYQVKYREGGDNSGRRYSGNAQRLGGSFFTVRTQDRKCVDVKT
jgi:hypothetical protein